MKAFGELDSKFRFVILAAKRAKQLLQGAKPKIKSKSKNPIRIAQKEVQEGFIDYELVEIKKQVIQEPAEEGFIGEEIGAGLEAMEEEKPKKTKAKAKKPEKKPKKAAKKKPVKKAAPKSEKKEKTKKKKT